MKVRFSLRDIILGGQDGLVNVLGVILGVAAATSDARIVLVAGLAATFAESISMAAVAYTSFMAERDYYLSLLEREKEHIARKPKEEEEETKQIFEEMGFSGKLLSSAVEKIKRKKEIWLKLMMTHELGLTPTPPSKGQILFTSTTVGVSALVGSLIPLSPFLFLPVKPAVGISLLVSAATLFGVGYYKGKATKGDWVRSGLQILLIGITAAMVGYLIGLLLKVSGV